ncbi:MAG: ABC transporter substrate-binding protein [Pseudomonadota bacterium]
MFKALFVSAALFSMGAANAAYAGASAPNQPEALVEQAALSIEETQGEALADAVLSALDLELIAQFTLGRYATSLSSEDQSKFATALEAFLRKQLVAQSAKLQNVSLEVLQTANRNARDAIVTTRVTGFGEPLTLRWRVVQRKGAWSVVDLEFQGVWLAIEQRAQINAILSKPGAAIDDVIKQLG